MSTMEPLFMQIFDRKRWIEDQLKHQVESFGESLASNLLSEGQRPPPWLLTFESKGPIFADPKELNREQLISQILDRHSRVTTLANNNTLFILPTLKNNNVNLSSNSVFSKSCALNFDVKASDELVSSDVPEGSLQNPHTSVEAEVSKNYSKLRPSMRTQTLRSRQREIDMPPSKKAKAENHLVEEDTSHEFTGRVTQSMSTILNHDSVINGGKVTRSRSATRNHHSIDLSSKLTKLQKDILSLSSESIENHTLNSSLANGLYLDAAYTAHKGCQTTDSLSSRLSEITLVEPEHYLDGIEGCVPNENSIFAFDMENHENTFEVPMSRLAAANILPCHNPSTITHLNEDALHASGTVEATEVAERDTTEGPIGEKHEMEDYKCDSHLICRDWKLSGITDSSSFDDVTCKSSENAPSSSFLVTACELHDLSGHLTELQVCSEECALGSCLQQTPEEPCGGENMEFPEPDRDIFINNDSCDLNENSLSSSVDGSQKSLDTYLVNLNSAVLEDRLVPVGLIANVASRHTKVQLVHASNTVLQKEDLVGTSNEGPQEGPELPGEENSRVIIDTVLSKSSPVKDCMLDSSMDSLGHEHDLMDLSRKSSLHGGLQSTREEECCADPIEVFADVALAKKAEGSYPVETDHLPLSRIEECDSNEDHVANSDIDNRVSNNGQDEICDVVGTNVLEHDSNAPVSYAHASIPSQPSIKEKAAAYSSQDTEYMFKSGTEQDRDKEEMSEIPMQYMDGERSTRETETETIDGSLQRAGSMHCDDTVLHSSEANEVLKGTIETDRSAKEIMQRSISRSNLSPDTFQGQKEKIEGEKDAEELGIVEDRITPGAKTTCKAVQTRYFLRSSTSNNEHDAYDITWPRRKKMKTQSKNVLATSPKPRAERGKHIEEHLACMYRISLDNISGSSVDFQPSMLSDETKVVLSEAALASQYEKEHPNKKHRMMKDIRGKCQAVRTPLSIEHVAGEQFLDLADDDNSTITESTVLNLEQHYALKGKQDRMDTFELRSPTNFGSFENITFHTGEGSSYSHYSAGFSQQFDDDLAVLEEDMPEFEGFTISVPPIVEDGVIPDDSEILSLSKERASLLEQLCKSGSIVASESCSSSTCNVHKIPNPYHSLSTDILERASLSVDLDQLRISIDDMETDPSCSLGSEFNSSLLRSHAYKLPSSNVRYAHKAGKLPFTPPVEKLQHKMISRKSISSVEELGSNPELVCFRIDEDSSTTEEPTSEHGVSTRGYHRSKSRSALADVTSVYQNMPKSVSIPGKYQERGSLDSSNAMPRLVMDCKENDNLSVNRNSVQTSANSFSNRFSKPAVSGNAIERNSGRTAEKLGNPSNIISNVSSFISLVREKQQAVSPGLGKRDIKVKALEAAEVAKRLEVKRKHEREMKKAAAKLERVRLEQENVRKLEFKQKEKEESRKKKEAEFEARKRQREVGKIEKERKKRCTEEVRKQQRVHVERIRGQKDEKELLDKNDNVKKRKGKELSKEPKKNLRLTKVREATAGRNTAEAAPTISKVVSGDPTFSTNRAEARGSFLKTNYSNKVVNHPSELRNAIQDRMSVTTESQDLQSYDISPYKDSDDEDGDEDQMRNRKSIPLWARRESLNQILLSNCHLDPAVIFSHKSSFNLNEVLLPKVQRLPL